jgi:hypothetical protein
MNRDKFDDEFSYFPLSEIIENSTSNNKIKKLLQTFKCNQNSDLQDFLHNKALVFEKNLRSRTYLYIDNNTKNVVAYFTIAINTLYTDNISSEVIKLLDGYRDDTKSIPCFLIGQLGKSISKSLRLSKASLIGLIFFHLSHFCLLSLISSKLVIKPPIILICPKFHHFINISTIIRYLILK